MVNVKYIHGGEFYMLSKEFYDYTIFENGEIYKGEKRVSIRINDGRYETRLTIEGKRKNFILARLMFLVFKEFNIDDKNLCICNKDGDKLNINLDNLYLEDRKNLIQGDKHKNQAKISDLEAEEIRKEYNGKVGSNQHDKIGLSLNDLAKKYNVTKGLIAQIVSGRCRNKSKYILK